MRWAAIKETGFVDIEGTRYDVTHLNDRKYPFSIPATDKYSQADFELLVQYSSHCVSWGPKRGESIDFDLYGQERRIIDDKGIHRCFCNERYALSKNLPDVIRTLPDRKCIFTGYENWLTVEIVTPEGGPREYEVFFSLARQGKKMVRAYVESAYIRDPQHAQRTPKGRKKRDKINGRLLLLKKLRRQPISKPPR